MVLYKAGIMPKSAFSSPLQSDTFFGSFCWSYRYLYGESGLEKLLHKSVDEKPQIIFSNAYPENYLPLPMGVYDTERQPFNMAEMAEAKKIYQQNKKYKKFTLIHKDAFKKIQNGERKGYSQFLNDEQIVQVNSVHNMVGRADGTVGSTEGSGNLFVMNGFYTNKFEIFDVYILSVLDKDIIWKVLLLMSELGIGAGKSSGKGHFEPISINEETELATCQNANGYMAISNFIPAAGDPSDGWYKTFVKYGKLDREYAAGQFPFKKPLLYIQSGAVFKTSQPKPWYGSCITNAAAVNGIVINACTVALQMHIPG